jgi:acetyl esterase/lipase
MRTRAILTASLVAVLGTLAPAFTQQAKPHQLHTLGKFNPPYRLPEEVVVKADVVFASPGGRDLHADIFSPAVTSGASPAVLFIQGSGYNGNNKIHFWREAAELARAGFVTLTIEHRGPGPDGVRWPEQLADGEAALRRMAANASEYRIDLTRAGVVGASSGAHIAALLAAATPASCPDRPKVRAVVLINGLLDLEYFIHNRLWAGDYGTWVNPASLLNVSHGKNMELWNAASAIAHVRADRPPTLVVHGTADATLPIEQARRYHEAAVAVGMSTEFVSIEGGGHEMTNEFAYVEVVQRIQTFLRRTLEWGPPANPPVKLKGACDARTLSSEC